MRRGHIIYIIFGMALIVEVAGLFFNSGVVEGMNSRADKLKVYAFAERDDKTILPGDIYDRNGSIIVKSTYESAMETPIDGEGIENAVISTSYSDGKAFSQIIGYTGVRELNPLADDKDKVVGTRNAYRLMAFLDEDYWGENGLHSTDDIDSTKGDSATLTIDSELQLAVYDILSAEMSDGSDIGSAVVMDVETGEILSMVAFPSYDFNDLGVAKVTMNEDEKGTNLEPSFPVSYKNAKAPGSIFKILTAVALIDHGMEDFKAENLSFEVNDWTCNASGYNSSTLKVAVGDTIGLETALNISSNTYFARAALELGKDNLRDTAEKFKLIESSSGDENIKYLETDFGNVPYNWDLNVTDDILAQTGFGQGLTEWTTVYAAMVTQTIANDGIMMQPYMVKNLFNEKGEIVYEGNPKVLSEATGKSTADKVTSAMRSTAVETCNAHGLSEVKEVFDRYQVAGKTGTAENGDENDTNNAWYISFAPADNPQYVVVVNQCKTNKKGYHMMPVVADIYEYLFEEYR